MFCGGGNFSFIIMGCFKEFILPKKNDYTTTIKLQNLQFLKTIKCQIVLWFNIYSGVKSEEKVHFESYLSLLTLWRTSSSVFLRTNFLFSNNRPEAVSENKKFWLNTFDFQSVSFICGMVDKTRLKFVNLQRSVNNSMKVQGCFQY